MVNTTKAAVNHQRGGTDALNAPLATIMRQPGLEAVSARMVRRFSDVEEHSSLSPLLGVLLANTESFWSQKHPFTGRVGQSMISDFAGARSSVQWLSLSDGGWEAVTSRNGIWVAPAYGFLKHRGNRDYTIRGAGVTFGLDRYVASNLYLGLALSLDYPRYKSDDADVDARGAAGIFYGGLNLPRGLELGFSGSLGGMRFEQTRTVSGNRYDSSYDATTLSVGASIGRRFEVLENFMLRPFADWNYFYSSRDSYSERADVYGLRYEDSRNHLHRLQAGLEGVWARENGSIGAKVYWSGLRGDTKEASAASFVLDPDANRFNAPVDGLDENSLGLGLNAGIRLGANTELRLEYSLLRGETTIAHQSMIGLRHEF
jgi:outer membrane autotransporter protein